MAGYVHDQNRYDHKIGCQNQAEEIEISETLAGLVHDQQEPHTNMCNPRQELVCLTKFFAVFIAKHIDVSYMIAQLDELRLVIEFLKDDLRLPSH